MAKSIKVILVLLIVIIIGNLIFLGFLKYEMRVSTSIGTREYDVLRKVFKKPLPKSLIIEKARYNLSTFIGGTAFIAYKINIDEKDYYSFIDTREFESIDYLKVGKPSMQLADLMDGDFLGFCVKNVKKEDIYKIKDVMYMIVTRMEKRVSLYVYIDPFAAGINTPPRV